MAPANEDLEWGEARFAVLSWEVTVGHIERQYLSRVDSGGNRVPHRDQLEQRTTVRASVIL